MISPQVILAQKLVEAEKIIGELRDGIAVLTDRLQDERLSNEREAQIIGNMRLAIGDLQSEIVRYGEERDRLREVLKICKTLISTGVLGRVFGMKPIGQNVEDEINSCMDKINAALQSPPQQGK